MVMSLKKEIILNHSRFINSNPDSCFSCKPNITKFHTLSYALKSFLVQIFSILIIFFLGFGTWSRLCICTGCWIFNPWFKCWCYDCLSFKGRSKSSCSTVNFYNLLKVCQCLYGTILTINFAIQIYPVLLKVRNIYQSNSPVFLTIRNTGTLISSVNFSNPRKYW